MVVLGLGLCVPGCANGQATKGQTAQGQNDEGQATQNQNDEGQKNNATPAAPGKDSAMLELQLTPATGTQINVKLANTGEEAVLVNARLGVSRPRRGGDVFFDIKDSTGKDVEFTARVNIGKPAAADFKQLEPGQAVERTVDLATYFALGNASGPLRIVATYANQYEAPEGKAWQTEITSEPLSLELP